MPRFYSCLSVCFLFTLGCKSITDPKETIQLKNTVTQQASRLDEIYKPTKDGNVLKAFDVLYDLSPTAEDIRFEPSEFIYFDTPQSTPTRKAYSVLYKAAHKQRLTIAPFCSAALRDANCDTWWKVKHCDEANCKTKITPASGRSQGGCLIDDKTTYTNTVHPIGKHFFREAIGYASPQDAPSKEEQLENFFRIECS